MIIFSVLHGLCFSDPAEDALHATMQRDIVSQMFRLDTQKYSENTVRDIDKGFRYDVCRWRGITCTDGKATSLSLTQNTYSICLDIHWLPPTLTSVTTQSIAIISRLYTSRLPRSLTRCVIRYGDLHGSLDLRTLPAKMEVLDLRRNALGKILYVGHMPETMKRIFLAYNLFTKVVVCNVSLPRNLEEIQVMNALKKVKLSCVDDKRVDSRVHTSRFTRADPGISEARPGPQCHTSSLSSSEADTSICTESDTC